MENFYLSRKSQGLKSVFLNVLLFLSVLVVTQNSYAQCTGPANDCDGDMVLNENDLDDDNDGLLDTEECGIRMPIDFAFVKDPEDPIMGLDGGSQNGLLATLNTSVTSGTETINITGDVKIAGDMPKYRFTGATANQITPKGNALRIIL